MLYFLTEKKQKGAYKNMSQAKVDRYKEEKKNRKQTIQKEKRNRVLGRTLGVVIAAASYAGSDFPDILIIRRKSR